MNLSPHFSLSEFVDSPTANRLHINNTPSFGIIQNLGRLCTHVLEPLRMHVGKPVTINSGYRCEALNKAVGGVWNSNHLYGYAADIHIDNIEEGRQWFEWIKQTCKFDELIWESTTTHHPSTITQHWIHVAYRFNRNRQKVIEHLAK